MQLSKNVRRKAIDMAKKNVAFRKAARIVRRHYLTRDYVKKSRKRRTDDTMVYFNTFNGRSYADSPKAIYEYMLSRAEYKDYRFVWAFTEPEKYEFLTKNRNTRIVKFNSDEERSAMMRAKYWIVNYRLLDHLIPKEDQIYVQCWHGTPLKRLGYDLINSDNAMNSVEETRTMYKIDAERFRYLLSPNSFSSEKFSTAWNLAEFGKEDTIQELGYPRNDRLATASAEDVAAARELVAKDVPADKKIILYAPTWRDNQHDSKVGYVYKPKVDFEYLKEMLSDQYVILFRAHYLVANSFDFDKYRGFIYDVSGHDDINDLYLASDMLITDYSSAFFDYAVLKKPIAFYMYDKEDYADSIRGFYLSLDELPGNIVETEESLVKEIEVIGEGWKPDEKYQQFNEKFNKLDDGHAAERLTRKIFGK